MRQLLTLLAAAALLTACAERPAEATASAQSAPPQESPAPESVHEDDDAAEPTQADHGHSHEGPNADHSH